MLYTHVGELPRHIDCWVDDVAVLREPKGEVLPCRWFGLSSHPGRMWGCTVLLENGAIYRDVPPHMMAFREKPKAAWLPSYAQRWDCYGLEFTTIAYSVLADLKCQCRFGDGDWTENGRYLFTAAPIGDGFSDDPRQDKEFWFVALHNGRLTIQPTDKVQFTDGSWTTHAGKWPSGLKRSDTIWRCE
jgi:hypothetical protein